MIKRIFILSFSIILSLTLSACFPLSLLLSFEEDPLESVDTDTPSAAPSEEEVNTKPEPTAEILFCNIPWGSNPTVANELMGGHMFLGKDVYIRDWSYAHNPVSAGVYQGGHILTGSGADIAGYPVLLTTMYFMYSLDTEIDRSVDGAEFYLANYQFDVVDVNGAYDDLRSKLTALYGTGAEECHTVTHWVVSTDGYSGEYDTLERVTTWIGGNKTQIVLTCASLEDDVDVPFGSYLLLTYGKTDVDERLENLTAAIREETAKAEEANRDSQNTNGL